MLKGSYTTKSGSRLEIDGKFCGKATLDFDWLEEGACCECKPDPYPHEFDEDHWRITWECDYCDGGSARLFST